MGQAKDSDWSRPSELSFTSNGRNLQKPSTAHQNPRTHCEERCIPTSALAHGKRSFFNVTRILVGRRLPVRWAWLLTDGDRFAGPTIHSIVSLSHPTHRIVGWDKRKIRIGVDQASCHSQATVGTCKSRAPAHQNPAPIARNGASPHLPLRHGKRSFLMSPAFRWAGIPVRWAWLLTDGDRFAGPTIHSMVRLSHPTHRIVGWDKRRFGLE